MCMPCTGAEDAIEIYTPERPYTIYTRSNSEKRLWLNKLRDTIYKYLLKKGKCERNDNCSTGKCSCGRVMLQLSTCQFTYDYEVVVFFNLVIKNFFSNITFSLFDLVFLGFVVGFSFVFGGWICVLFNLVLS